jgi:hydrogenase maturation protease
MQHRWLLIGIGNEYRSDDGIGLLVARKIGEKKLSSVIVKEESGEGAALMEAWKGFEDVIVVDAVSSGSKPGTIFKMNANKERVPAKFFHCSTHAFSVAEAIELARTMKTLPATILLYGIEGENFAAGTGISFAVEEAARQVIRQTMNDVGGAQ